MLNLTSFVSAINEMIQLSIRSVTFSEIAEIAAAIAISSGVISSIQTMLSGIYALMAKHRIAIKLRDQLVNDHELRDLFIRLEIELDISRGLSRINSEKQAIKLIENQIESVSQRDRDAISEGLHQNNRKGAARFTRELIRTALR